MTWDNLNELLKVKIAALIHDPPWKVWVFAHWPQGRPRGPLLSRGKEIREKSHIEAHEADAVALGEIIGFKEIIEDENIREIVKVADRVATTFDRLLLPSDEKYKAEKVKMLNIFDPKKELTLIPPNKGFIIKFMNELSTILRSLSSKNLLLTYHVLWFAYEPLWYRFMNKSTSPADTRVPTHSVFDHNYATAMVSNIVAPSSNEKLEPEFTGYVVVVDFAGVQRYISQSRKLRDMWASSWISSLLAWIAIEPFVACIGPDVVVSPSLRGNWFYIAWLIESASRVDRDVAAKLKEIAESSYAYPGWPKHPLMPTRVILVLPKIEDAPTCYGDKCTELYQALRSGVNSIKEYMRRYIKERWGKALKAIINELEKLVSVSIKLNELKVDCQTLLGAIERIVLRPPLPLRVIVLELNASVSDRYLRWLNKLKLRERLPYWWALFYHYIMAVEVPAREALYKLSRVEPDAIDSWRIIGEIIKKTKFCSVCGERPAVIAVPRGKYQDFKAIASREELKIEPGLISEGERLCPLCAVKRLFSFHYERVLKELNMGCVSEDKRIYLPSTFDIANLDKIRSWYEGVAHIVKEAVEKNALPLLVGRFNIRRLDVGGLDEKMREDTIGLCSSIVSKDTVQACVNVVQDLLGAVVEASMNREVRRELESKLQELNEQYGDIVKEINKLVETIRKEYSTRYAIVKGDGDRIGSRLHKGILGIEPRAYIESIARAVWGTVNNRISKWINTYEEVCKTLGGVTIPLTPSYHYSISRALSIAAIRDALIIEKHRGFVIYVGGDDILAISPIRMKQDISVLNIVINTRKNYWGMYGDDCNGFFTLVNPFEVRAEKVGPVLAPAMRSYGRSYSVTIAHYRDPMKIAINRSAELEEIAKEKVMTIKITSKVFNKISNQNKVSTLEEICRKEKDAVCRDRLALEEMRSGIIATLPLSPLINKASDSEVARIIEDSTALFNMIGSEVSKSFLYDIRTQFSRELIELIRGKHTDGFIKVLRHVTFRNASENAAKKVLNTLNRFCTYVNVYEEYEIAKTICGTNEVIVPLPLDILSAVLVLVKASSR